MQIQNIIGFYIVDFIVNDLFIVEIDGKNHLETKEYDNKRDNYLRKKGYKVIRIKNEEVSRYDMKSLRKKTQFNPVSVTKKQWLLRMRK